MERIFIERKDRVIQLWIDAIFALYPFETTGFMRTQKDCFANPTGHATALACTRLYDAIAGTANVEDDVLRVALAELIRIRAVQELEPARAIGALFLVKPILREVFLTDALATGTLEAYLDAESRVDTLALLGCNMYMADKEAVFASRVGEVKRRYAQMERWVVRHGGIAAMDTTPTDGTAPSE